MKFPLDDPRKVFCCPAHKKAYHNRDLAVGGSLVILAKAWRQGRHRKADPLMREAAKYAFSEFCLALDRATADDRASGRAPALEVLTGRYRRQGIIGSRRDLISG